MSSTGAPNLFMDPTCRSIPSLLGAPIADIDDVGRGDVCMIGLFDDHSDTARFGARFAARQIRYASQHDADPRLATPGANLVDLGDLNVFPLERDRNSSALIRQLKSIIAKGAVPVIVGGTFSMGPLMQQALERADDRKAALFDLPGADPSGLAANDRIRIALTVNLSTWDQLAITAERPVTRLRHAIEALSPQSIGAVHLTGLAPELDFCGRYETGLGHHVLGIIVAHLRRAGA
jgi:hypothetical protein